MGSELKEEEFIQPGGYRKRPWILWLFLCVVVGAFLLIWGLSFWQQKILQEKRGVSPFLQVTNREFSLFLWQNPEFMRKFAEHRLGYLPHFSSDDDIRVVPDMADVYVSAPPEVLFRYHVWDRLLGKSLAPRPIPEELFMQFLRENREWKPEGWVVNGEGNVEGLSFDVRFAFQGWRNFFLEWDAIEAVDPTKEEWALFLEAHPEYARHLWQNIVEGYLVDELPDFLKVGYFNFTQK